MSVSVSGSAGAPPQRGGVAAAVQRVYAVVRAWIAPRCPSPAQYWAEPDPAVSWWRAL